MKTLVFRVEVDIVDEEMDPEFVEEQLEEALVANPFGKPRVDYDPIATRDVAVADAKRAETFARARRNLSAG